MLKLKRNIGQSFYLWDEETGEVLATIIYDFRNRNHISLAIDAIDRVRIDRDDRHGRCAERRSKTAE